MMAAVLGLLIIGIAGRYFFRYLAYRIQLRTYWWRRIRFACRRRRR